jgi:hypothetical protein
MIANLEDCNMPIMVDMAAAAIAAAIAAIATPLMR